MRFFMVQEEKIVNIILAESQEIAEIVTGLSAIAEGDSKVQGSDIGFVWDEASGQYVMPEQPDEKLVK